MARQLWDDSEVEGFVTLTVSNDWGKILFEVEEFFYIAPSGEFSTVIFPSFFLEKGGVYWFTASLGEELYYPQQGRVIFFNLFNAETRQMTTPAPSGFCIVTDARMYTVSGQTVDIFTLPR